MKLDGMLERVQLEEIASSSPTPACRSRIYSDITDTTKPLPRFYDGSRFVALMMRKKNTVVKSTTYSMTILDEILLCDATSAAFTVTLPDASTCSGEIFYIQKNDSSFNKITLSCTGGQSIEGSSSIKLCTKQDYVILLSSGTGWYLFQHGYYAGRISYTPTGSWTANSTYTGFCWREGNTINLDVKIALSGAPTAAALTLTLPGSLTVDTSQLTGPTAGLTPFSGNVMSQDISLPGKFIGLALYGSSTTVAIYSDNGDSTASPLTSTVPVTFATGDSVNIKVLGIPITDWLG
jgi:hypothetical protein